MVSSKQVELSMPIHLSRENTLGDVIKIEETQVIIDLSKKSLNKKYPNHKKEFLDAQIDHLNDPKTIKITRVFILSLKIILYMTLIFI